MKEGTFTRWLKAHYGNTPFLSSGKISKTFVRENYTKWTPQIQRKAIFFLNTVKRNAGK